MLPVRSANVLSYETPPLALVPTVPVGMPSVTLRVEDEFPTRERGDESSATGDREAINHMWSFLSMLGGLPGTFSSALTPPTASKSRGSFFGTRQKNLQVCSNSKGMRLHVRQIKDRIKRLANDRGYREQFLRPLEFPVERYW